MAFATQLDRQHILLENISWQTYKRLLKDWGEHRGSRIAYDQGMLEIMTPSKRHEGSSTLISWLIEAFAEELEIDMAGAGSTTLDLEHLEKGIEPDECFYIQNEPRVRGKENINLMRDPPPDLAVEVEVSRSALDKLRIHASLRIPEVWQYNGKELRIHRLQKRGKYVEVEKSIALPQLPIQDLLRFLRKQGTMSDTRLVRSFRAWVRSRFKR